MAKDTLWFPHDYNARADEKTAALLNDYGALGYGVFQIITEILHEEDESRIQYEDKKLRRLAATCKVDYEKFKLVIDDCIHVYELWTLEDGYFFSDRVNRNKEDRERIRQKRIEAGQKGGEANASKIKANASKNRSGAKANVKQIEANSSTGQDNTVQDNKSSKEDIDIWLQEKKDRFKKMVAPFVDKYGKELCNDFWYYWVQPHKTLKQVRWEGEKYFDIDARLRTFKKNATKQY